MGNTAAPSEPTLRKATEADADSLLGLIDALAEYERLVPPDAEARTRLIRDMTSARPRFDAYLAEVDGEDAGYAIVFETYSSFLALPTLFLEDLFVLPRHRNRRVGFSLFTPMVGEALRRGAGRMEWTVLSWNRLALDFYERLGGHLLAEWQVYRLLRADMERILTLH
jgi:GNAT superfamily N-acetyltransferase